MVVQGIYKLSLTLHMMFDWQRIDLLPVFALAIFTIGYLLYYFIAHSTLLRRKMEYHLGVERTKVRWVLFQRLTGFIFLGMIPAMILPFIPLTLEQVGIAFKNMLTSLSWIAAIGAVVVVVNFFAARKPGNLSMYPQIRINGWTYRILIASSLGWMLYLLGYEFMFRGLLLFSGVPVFGIWPAIVLNVSLYAIVHIPKGLRETIASIPLGLILCVLTIKTGTIWIAYFTHVILALSNEYLSLYFHPEMRLGSKH